MLNSDAPVGKCWKCITNHQINDWVWQCLVAFILFESFSPFEIMKQNYLWLLIRLLYNYFCNSTALFCVHPFFCLSRRTLVSSHNNLTRQGKTYKPRFRKSWKEKNVKTERERKKRESQKKKKSCPRQVLPHPDVAVWSITQRHGREKMIFSIFEKNFEKW